MEKIIKLTESDVMRVIKQVLSEQQEYTDFDTIYDYKTDNDHWFARKKTNTSGKWYDITDRPEAVDKLNARYGTNIQTTAPKPAPPAAPVTPKSKTKLPVEPINPSVSDKTATVKPISPPIKPAASPTASIKPFKPGLPELDPASSESTFIKKPIKVPPPAGAKPQIILDKKSPKPQDIPDFTNATNIPNDVKMVVNDKKSNPKFKTFIGKYYVLSKENSTMYVFNNNHKLIDQAIVGRGIVVGDFPNASDPDSEYPGPHATTPAGAGVFTDTYYDPEYGGRMSSIKYNKPGMGDNLAMHPIYPPEFAKRNAILQDPAQVDKLMSWGCINVPNEKLFSKTFGVNAGDSIFITKEPQRLQAQALANAKMAKGNTDVAMNKPINENKFKTKKTIRVTESQLVGIISKIINEQTFNQPLTSSFTASAIVEDDMMMRFHIDKFAYIDGSLMMYITSPVKEGEVLYVSTVNNKFGGPIYSAKTNRPIYSRSIFRNITPQNYKEIAQKYNIRMITT